MKIQLTTIKNKYYRAVKKPLQQVNKNKILKDNYTSYNRVVKWLQKLNRKGFNFIKNFHTTEKRQYITKISSTIAHVIINLSAERQ